jgi:hypothetical protein
VKLNMGDIEKPKYWALKFCERKEKVELGDKAGIHIKERRLSNVDGGHKLTLSYRLDHDIALVPRPGHVILRPIGYYARLGLKPRRDFHRCHFWSYGNYCKGDFASFSCERWMENDYIVTTSPATATATITTTAFKLTRTNGNPQNFREVPVMVQRAVALV